MNARVAVALGGVSETTDHCYLQVLRETGLDPVGILPAMAEDEVREAIRSSAGLVLSGGADIHPARYGEGPDGSEMKFVSEARDAMELAALAEADALGLPVLAICRGMQMLNVFRGGALLQDIGQDHRDGRRQEDKWQSWHAVDAEAGTRLAALFEDEMILANSRHHQAVDPDRLGSGLRVIGWCPSDGIVEAVEQPGDRFVLGVQWHPENMALGPDGAREQAQAKAVFEAFAKAVREFAPASSTAR